MKRLFYFILVYSGLILFSSYSSYACTAFLLGEQDQQLVAKSYDWNLKHGLLSINKRGLRKTSLGLYKTDIPIHWKSKFGSITFNQYAIEFPVGGMNEAGLTAEVLWLNDTEYPDISPQKSVNELQWVSFMLDQFETIDEVIRASQSIRVSAIYGKVHYFVCDRFGDCGVFEFLNGHLVVNASSRKMNSNFVKAITNNTYMESLNTLEYYLPFGGKIPLPNDSSSLSRFARAAATTIITDNTELLALAKNTLDSVASGSFSVWNIIYQPNQQNLMYKTRFGKQIFRKIDLHKFDFSCSTPRKVLDIEVSGTNLESKFTDYNSSHNQYLIERSLSFLPLPVRSLIQNYPNTQTCN